MKETTKDLARFRLEKPGVVHLKDHPTHLSEDPERKKLQESVEKDKQRIIELQELLYARGSHAFLMVFQAMDGAGKDSAIAHVLGGVNPQGCRVWSFKAPSAEELSHDFLWRHAQAIPARGLIGVHNRSHYEEVVVVRVHPEYVVGQRIPGIGTVDKIGADFWKGRYASIRHFEKHLAGQGVVIMKFFLHMSKAVQKERFLERIDDPAKNWKFSPRDVQERGHWDAYQQAYEAAIGATAAPHAPWHIIPADDQWETRAIVAGLVRERLEALDLRPAGLDAKAKAELKRMRELLSAADA